MGNDNKQFISILKMLASGTPLREGIENILRAKKGALIVLGDNESVHKILDGGFMVNTDLTPAHLYELAKMDGALILDNTGKKILYANVQLVPDTTLPTTETGTRHRSAERSAKQTKCPVICISEQRNIITLYFNDRKYVLNDLASLLAKANQALRTLEKYRAVWDEIIDNLNVLEMEDFVTISDVVLAIQRAEMVLKIKSEIERYLIELGTEGRLLKMQLGELTSWVEEEEILIIKDYLPKVKEAKKIKKEIDKLQLSHLLNLSSISEILGFGIGSEVLDKSVSPRGYRALRRLPRIASPLPFSVIEKLVETYRNLQGILHATPDELDDVEGIGEIRAKVIFQGLKRMREQLILNRSSI